MRTSASGRRVLEWGSLDRSAALRRSRGLVRVFAGIGYHNRFDGAARSFLNLLVRLPDHGYSPVVAFVGEGRCVEAYRDAGVDVRVLEADSGFDQFNKAWLQAGSAWRIRSVLVGLPALRRQVNALMRDEGVRLAHFNETRALLALGWGPWLSGVPTILHVRGSLRPLPPPLRLAAQALPRRLVLVGHGIEDEILRPFRSKATVIYNSVTVPDERSSPAPPDDGVRPLTVLTLAAFEPFKGYHHLARAAAAVSERLVPRRVVFRWLGNTVDADYVRHLRTLLRDLGLSNVELVDWMPDVSDELARADLVVLPTIDEERLQLEGRTLRLRSSEGVPRCLLEAAAFGRATVATAVGGIPEAVVHEATGLVVPPSDPVALARAIGDLLVDPGRRTAMGEAGRRHVAQHFTHERLVRRVAAEYDALRAQSPLESPA